MGHPLIDEFCRANTFSHEFLRRCQREFRNQIDPQLAERDQLLVEVADLRAENEILKARKGRKAEVPA